MDTAIMVFGAFLVIWLLMSQRLQKVWTAITQSPTEQPPGTETPSGGQ